MAGDVPWVHPDPPEIEAVPDLLERLVAVNRALAATERIADELLRIRYEAIQAVYDDPHLTVHKVADPLDVTDRRIRQYPTPTTHTHRPPTLARELYTQQMRQ